MIVWAVRIFMRRALALGEVGREEFYVAPGAECLAGAGDDAYVDVRVQSDVAPAGAQFDIGVAVQRVAEFRTVDRDIGDVAFFLILYVFQVLRCAGGIVRGLWFRHDAGSGFYAVGVSRGG